jgi:hypothetical protein
MNNNININGLLDGISVIEANNNTDITPTYSYDTIYNSNEPFDLNLQSTCKNQPENITHLTIQNEKDTN